MERELCATKGVESFDALGVGPLLKNPLIIKYFQPPPTLVSIPEITTTEVISALQEYRQKDYRITVVV